MRTASAALLALIGFVAAALPGGSAGAPLEEVLPRALAALVLFGALGYGVGAAGERLVAELSARREEEAKAAAPPAPPPEGAPPPPAPPPPSA